MTRVSRLSMMVGLIVFGACNDAEPVMPQATVFFELDAPLCSSVVPVEFTIDNVQVGADTFVVGIAGRNHSKSRGFVTGTGVHTLSARTTAGYAWPDRRVTLPTGAVVTDSLPFYCS